MPRPGYGEAGMMLDSMIEIPERNSRKVCAIFSTWGIILASAFFRENDALPMPNNTGP